ncbi:TPA: hypothetical protein ACSP7Y_005138 [Serratia fonticola]
MHEYECLKSDPIHPTAPALARFSLGQATALKATYEAGRRGGDSIAQRVNFFQKNNCFSRRDGRFRALQRGIEKPPKLYQLRPDLTVTADRTQSYLTVGFERKTEVSFSHNFGRIYKQSPFKKLAIT